MEIVKENDGSIIRIKNNESEIRFVNYYGENGDLYLNFFTPTLDSSRFRITKDDFEVYAIFKRLFDEIKEVKVYESVPELDDFLQVDYKNLNESLKKSSCYENLYDKESNYIRWISDDAPSDIATSFTLIEEEDAMCFYFGDARNGLTSSIKVQISTNGSRYDSFFVPFLRAHEALNSINPDFYQMSIDEYCYLAKKMK